MTSFYLLLTAGILATGMLALNWLVWRQERADRRAKLASPTKKT